MIFLPESNGCDLPISLIDGECFGLFGEKREKVISKYQKNKNGITNLSLDEIELDEKLVTECL